MKMGGAAVAGALLPVQGTKARQHEDASGKPKNIVFMVTDGMSAGVPALAEAYSHLLRGTGTHFNQLMIDPNATHGFFDMASLNSLVTDSAAAASAWGSGSRLFNGAVNMLPGGRPLTPIIPLARQRGYATGLVTTTRITHATPAGFAAVAPSRDLEDDIAAQYLDIVDVLLGGGLKHFDPEKRTDKRDLTRAFRQAGYNVCRWRDELLAADKRGRVLGLFHHDHLPYSLDQRHDPKLQKQVPTLAEMTAAALETLSRSDGGFLLQVEGGRIDHAAHDNDGAGLLHDQLEFDVALGVVREFASAHHETLVVVTTDHGTGNPGLVGLGGKYHLSTAAFEKLASATASMEMIVDGVKALGGSNHTLKAEADAIANVIATSSGLAITDKECQPLADVLNGRPIPELNLTESTLEGLIGQIIGNHTGIFWTGITHTSDWAMTLAFGPGRERFNGLLKNTDVYSHLTQMLGIDHRNPAMSVDEARKFTTRAPRAMR